jgi:hypothetical protein
MLTAAAALLISNFPKGFTNRNVFRELAHAVFEIRENDTIKLVRGSAYQKSRSFVHIYSGGQRIRVKHV